MKLSYELYGVKRLKGLYIALFKFISDKKMRRCTFVKQYDMTDCSTACLEWSVYIIRDDNNKIGDLIG